jgi:hypothetical protein
LPTSPTGGTVRSGCDTFQTVPRHRSREVDTVSTFPHALQTRTPGDQTRGPLRVRRRRRAGGRLRRHRGTQRGMRPCRAAGTIPAEPGTATPFHHFGVAAGARAHAMARRLPVSGAPSWPGVPEPAETNLRTRGDVCARRRRRWRGAGQGSHPRQRAGVGVRTWRRRRHRDTTRQ